MIFLCICLKNLQKIDIILDKKFKITKIKFKKLNNFFSIKATYSITELSRKINENSFGQTPEDEDEKEDAKFLSKIRLVIGGLLLPTIAISIDKLILNRLNLVNSAFIRVAIVS